MFPSDFESIEYFHDHPDELRARARQVFRKYIDMQLRMKKQGGTAWVESWHWPEAIAEVLRRPESSTLVRTASDRLHVAAQPWSPERYDDESMFERLIDQFERAIE
jgi:hypothetical protein